MLRGMRRRIRRKGKGYRRACLLGVLAIAAETVSPPAHLAPTTAPVNFAAAVVPTPAHIVIVVEENRSQSNIIGNKSAPFINQLAANGAMMAQSYAEVHPSEPNYYALFAGSTLGVKDNICPVNGGNTPNLGSELLAAGYTFAGYAESLPAVGSTACGAGKYARKHVPWASFTNIGGSHSLPFSAFPSPQNYASLPTVSFVIPNLDNDMHDGSIGQGDSWLYQNLSPYAAWAKANNSLLILTWDEDDNSSRNQIPTVFYGANVKPGTYSEPISHYNVLSTVEQMYGLPKLGYATRAPAITDIWLTSAG
ncbi:acid phosphatase [Mycobacterium fragae]|nr:alkaline phosphatase family protein [Mycobacterium fragae]MCV7401865.1 acid phosphatase [Mycobacterium fragae]